VYVGAFERIELASELVAALRGEHAGARVAYRVGRAE
jgi:hypothetical protein